MYSRGMFAVKLSLVSIVALFTLGSAYGQCPSISVQGPTSLISVGDEATFRAELGTVGPRVSYRWSVSAGTMIKGQGSPEISVKTDDSMTGSNFTVTVEIDGIASGCKNSGTATAAVATKIACILIEDEWGDVKPSDIRGRLDNFFADLSNNPTHTGIVKLIVTADEPMDLSNKRLKFILRHTAYRKFDRSRMWFQFELGEKIRTAVHRIVPGGEPLCKDCLTIKGADIQ